MHRKWNKDSIQLKLCLKKGTKFIAKKYIEEYEMKNKVNFKKDSKK